MVVLSLKDFTDPPAKAKVRDGITLEEVHIAKTIATIEIYVRLLTICSVAVLMVLIFNAINFRDMGLIDGFKFSILCLLASYLHTLKGYVVDLIDILRSCNMRLRHSYCGIASRRGK
jgi:hypothetical protein